MKIKVQGPLDKRTYIEQVTLKKECPNCNNLTTLYLNEYLSYPDVGETICFSDECSNCKEEVTEFKTIKAIYIELEDEN